MNIKEFFEDILIQDPKRLKRYFCEDAVIRWHCTNEQFSIDECAGRMKNENFVAVCLRL